MARIARRWGTLAMGLVELNIDPPLRGQGLGTFLLGEALRQMGLTHIYDSRTLDFAGALRADTKGQGVDVVLKSLSGPALEESLSLVAPGGRFIELGKQDATLPFCALASIDFDGSTGMRVTRHVTFHDGHASCADAYRWGMQFVDGTKG
jgi:NADPH:quinone reductase-like Zn-dependent oxidoreductase